MGSTHLLRDRIFDTFWLRLFPPWPAVVYRDIPQAGHVVQTTEIYFLT